MAEKEEGKFLFARAWDEPNKPPLPGMDVAFLKLLLDGVEQYLAQYGVPPALSGDFKIKWGPRGSVSSDPCLCWDSVNMRFVWC